MTEDYTKVKPYNQDDEKTAQLEQMFNTISAGYDNFNDLMTWGMVRGWRRKALCSLRPYEPGQMLDIAAGTADMCIKAHKFLNPDFVTGIDISDGMLQVGREKVAAAGLSGKVRLQVMDCASMIFPDASFDAATIAFGIRNFEKLDTSIQEIHRVLRPNGKLLIIEMNEPQKGFMLWAYKLYVKIFVKTTTSRLSNDKEAYQYLTNSMHAFPNGERLIAILKKNGFKKIKYHKFIFNVCSMYLMEKV